MWINVGGVEPKGSKCNLKNFECTIDFTVHQNHGHLRRTVPETKKRVPLEGKYLVVKINEPLRSRWESVQTLKMDKCSRMEVVQVIGKVSVLTSHSMEVGAPYFSPS